MIIADINNFFLYAERKKLIYCEQPRDYKDPDKPNHVMMLVRSLYGTPDAPKLAAEKAEPMFKASKMKPTVNDPCFYIRRDGDKIALAVKWVDDIALATNDDGLQQEIITEWKKHFDFKFQFQPKVFLGYTINQDKESMTLNQIDKIEDFLRATNMDKSHPVRPPAVTNLLTKPDVTRVPTMERNPDYLKATGKLIWLSQSRFDCLYAINMCCRRMTSSNDDDDASVKRIARYFKSTPRAGLKFKPTKDVFQLCAYCDASFADNKDGKSTGGYFVGMENSQKDLLSVLIGKCFKQRLIAHSTLESELYSLVETVKSVEWCRNFLSELGFQQKHATNIYTDALYLSLTDCSLISKQK